MEWKIFGRRLVDLVPGTLILQLTNDALLNLNDGPMGINKVVVKLPAE